MAKIRDTENSQCVAELTQKISNLEFKVSKTWRITGPFLMWKENVITLIRKSCWPKIVFFSQSANICLKSFSC